MRDRELVWKMVAEMFAGERHFNAMQNHCRTLASTWLLAAFAGIGFVHTKDQFSDAHSAAALIAIATAIGVFLIWIIDVKIWHRLLLAYTLAGHLLEAENEWLPPVRANIRASSGWLPVRVHLSLFYAVGVIVLSAISAFSFWSSSSLLTPRLLSFLAALVGGGVAFAMIITSWATHQRDNRQMAALLASTKA
jgi:hypothetical protein